MAIQRTGRLRLWRLALKSIAVLSLITVLLVYVARLSDNYVCLQIGQSSGFNGQGVGLLDINRGVYAPDARTANGYFGQQSPDHNYVAVAQYNLETRTQDLILRSTTNEQPPITLQTSFPGNGNNYGRGFARVAWSPNSQSLAYLWTDTDQNLNLTVVNVDGSTKKTVSLDRSDPPQSGNQRALMIDGWSADGQFLSISQQNQLGQTDSLWSVADLNQAVAVFKTGAWSPQGHLYAGVRTNSDGDDEMVIWSPEKDFDTGAMVVPGQEVQLVNWSPDGRYFAVQSHEDCTNLVYCAQHWRYDMFSGQGNVLASDLQGQVLTTTNSGPTAVWSTDGQKWIFLREFTQNTDLMSWNATDNNIHVIADNLASGLTPEMFYTSSNRRYPGGASIPALYSQPTGKRLIIPAEHDGKIKIELADLDGGNRITLVDNADQILAPQQSTFSSQQFWSGDGGLVTIVWASFQGNNRQVHLTWAKADGSDHFEVSDDIQNIDAVQLMRPGLPGSQRWISYLALRNGVYGIEIAELDTGKHYRLFSGAQQNDSWSIAPSSDGHTIALVLQNYASTFFQNQLYLASLDGKPPLHISGDMLGLPSWSPDGSTVAYLEQDATRTNSYVKLTRLDGTTIKMLPIAPSEQLVLARFNRNQAAVYSWTTCS